MKTQIVDWKEFMACERRVVKCYEIDMRIIRKNAAVTLVQIAGITCIVLAAMPDAAFAATDTGIDAAAKKIYWKLANIGKWVIIIKGGIDTIKNVADGDVQTAKRNFLGYGVTYAILWGLPWMLGEIEKLFAEMGM